MADKVDLSGFDEVVNSTAAPTEYGTLGAGAMGAAKGATMSFDDEIAGAAGAAVKKMGGTDEDFWNIYKNIRDSVRHEHELAEQQHPYASVGGELAGGLATTLLTPLGAIGQVGKAASLGSKVVGAGKAGAAIGGISGLGGSQTELTDVAEKPEVLAKAAGDVAVGAGVGGIAGTGGQLVGSGLHKVGSEVVKGAKSLPFTKQLGELIKRTYAGEDLLGKTTQMAEETRNAGDMFLQAFNQLKSVTGKEYGDAFKELEKTGTKVDYKKLSDVLENEINTLKPKGAENKAQIEDLKSTIRDILDENKIVSTGEVSMLPEVGMTPKTQAAEKVESSMSTAVAKDKAQLAQLEEKASELKPGVGDEPSARYIALLNKIRTLEERIPETFSPEVSTEPLTGRTVHVATRGVGAPIAAAEGPGIAAGQITQEINPMNASPEQAKSSLSALSEFLNRADEAQSGIGKVYGTRAKEAVKGALDVATESQPQIKAMIQSASKRLGDVEKGLEQISPTPDLNATLDRLESAVRQYHKPGSQGERDINLALTELGKSFPDEAAGLKKMVQNASSREDLARALSGVSAFGKGLSETLKTGDIMGALGAGVHAGTLQTARLGTMAVKGTVENTKNIVMNTGKALYDKSPEQLQKLANYGAAQGSKAGQMLANTIQRALEAPMAKRKALLFTLMQQPDIRELIRNENPVGE